MKDNWLKPIKSFAQRLLPGPYTTIQTAFVKRKYDPLYRALVAAYGCKIAAGPFQNMVYLEQAYGSGLLPKLAGCYEMELNPTMEQIIESAPRVIVDVGCAEGYYAVGLARSLPKAQVVAYDIEPEAQEMCRDLAARNGVSDRVSVRGRCGADELNALPEPPSLLFCDCEGFELDLLDPEQIPCLRNCDMLVELHEAFRPGLTRTLLARFTDTHRIELVNSVTRDVNNIPTLQCVPPHGRSYVADEGRPGIMQWAYMVANNRSTPLSNNTNGGGQR